RLRARLPAIGDDAAVVTVPPGDLLLTADAVVSGVHFDLDLVGIDDVGWKALAVNVSDVAAMGGRPLHALVTVAGPLGGVDLDALYDGVLAAAGVFACPVVGGDLVAAPVLIGSGAMIDLSDGLASDLRHVAEASGVGVALDRVPVAVGVARAMGDDGVAAALGGGEDYELLFAAPDTGRVEDAFSAAGLTLPLAIGR